MFNISVIWEIFKNQNRVQACPFNGSIFLYFRPSLMNCKLIYFGEKIHEGMNWPFTTSRVMVCVMVCVSVNWEALFMHTLMYFQKWKSYSYIQHFDFHFCWNSQLLNYTYYTCVFIKRFTHIVNCSTFMGTEVAIITLGRDIKGKQALKMSILLLISRYFLHQLRGIRPRAELSAWNKQK